jgi:hypothetical protein
MGSEEPEVRRAIGRGRLVISVTCSVHGGTPGFTNLMVSKRDGDIVLDPHVTGACVIVLNETAATALFDFLGELLR